MSKAAAGIVFIVATAAAAIGGAYWWLRVANNDTPEDDSEDAGAANPATGINAAQQQAQANVAAAAQDTMSLVTDIFGGDFMPNPTGSPLIMRARSALGHGIKYQLGNGNGSPADLLPSRNGLCDCSGFISWLCGWKGHWCTDWLYDDANGKQTKVKRIAAPLPGCIGVYPGYKDKAGKHHFGHTALIVDPVAWTIIDCSKSQNGIAEHNGHYWAKEAKAIWCVPV